MVKRKTAKKGTASLYANSAICSGCFCNENAFPLSVIFLFKTSYVKAQDFMTHEEKSPKNSLQAFLAN
ncbi:hypothetical protein BK055_11665 [Bacillus velezensis]|nr:hypothetical protein BK055_11665 [Bacillus velezensis]